MDNLAILVCLIGMFIVFPFCIDGQTTTTTASTGCKVYETNSPPSTGCTTFCGDSIMEIFEYMCGDRRKRSSTGILFSEPYRGGHWVKRYCDVGLIFMQDFDVKS